jgi:hypothetical protein
MNIQEFIDKNSNIDKKWEELTIEEKLIQLKLFLSEAQMTINGILDDLKKQNEQI